MLRNKLVSAKRAPAMVNISLAEISNFGVTDQHRPIQKEEEK
jgi:hypothetical protein